MSKFIVEGPSKLSGEVNPVGNKNSVLKLIAASILFSGDYVLKNVPAISDVDVMLDILKHLGAYVEYQKENGFLKINNDNLHSSDIPSELAAKLRASVVFFGPLLARFGHVKGSMPGGDKISARELKAHFSGFIQMGVEFSGNEWGEFELKGFPNAQDILLYEPSVTATENLILAAALTPGKTIIRGAASEPHVQELCEWLQENGLHIEGIGSSLLTIVGSDTENRPILLRTDGREHEVWTDYLDVGAMIVAGAITKSELVINNVRHEDLRTIKFFYEQLGVTWHEDGDKLILPAEQEMKIHDKTWARTKGIYSQPWYSFPSDLMSMTIVMAMFCEGSVLFFEKLYSDRMAFVSAFNTAGANIFIADSQRIIVNGPTTLRGFSGYQSPDIRAGMAYLLAALASEGKSVVNGAEHIDRAYPNMVERFERLGAKISKED